jgi:nicotinate-nucleotide pyrophosphorylase (carboxylating)
MDEIKRFLDEDLGTEGDITSNALFSNEVVQAILFVKEKCIIAGLEEAKTIFEKTGAKVELNHQDGDFVKKNSQIALIYGPARSILKAERLCLNFLGRMSGIASETNSLIKIAKRKNPKVTILATRKTTPGFRRFEKKAVIIGGGEPHRFGLFDAFLIKDNHIKLIGSVNQAIQNVKQSNKNHKIIEIEVENETDALIAARLKVDIIMLDNFDSTHAEIVAQKIRQVDSNIKIEVSGGIKKSNIEEYASFADRISIGYITHSIKSKDFSLEII